MKISIAIVLGILLLWAHFYALNKSRKYRNFLAWWAMPFIKLGYRLKLRRTSCYDKEYNYFKYLTSVKWWKDTDYNLSFDLWLAKKVYEKGAK
jgi:hypothetical protein